MELTATNRPRAYSKRNFDGFVYVVLKVHGIIILDSSAVEHSAVNRRVVGSNPTRGAQKTKWFSTSFFCASGNRRSYKLAEISLR